MYMNLIQLRKKRSLSCADMAQKLKISTSYYWQIENKKRTLSYEMANKIANLLMVPPEEIFN